MECKIEIARPWVDWNASTAERHIDRPFYACKNLENVKDVKIRNIILEMADRIIEKFNPAKIILFGSQARGEANIHSDIDLLVIFNNEINRFQVESEIIFMLKDSPYPKDILARSKQDIKKSNFCGYTTYYALKEGVVLYG